MKKLLALSLLVFSQAAYAASEYLVVCIDNSGEVFESYATQITIDKNVWKLRTPDKKRVVYVNMACSVEIPIENLQASIKVVPTREDLIEDLNVKLREELNRNGAPQ